MIYSSDQEVLHIYKGLCQKTLAKSDWTHAAHFAAACAIMVDTRRHPFADMPYLIRSYNAAKGVANTESAGYHQTITRASLLAVQSHMQPSRYLYENVNVILSLEFGRPDWLFSYWTKDTLFSKAARKDWIAPDLKPFPIGKKPHRPLQGLKEIER